MPGAIANPLVEAVRRLARPLTGRADQYDELLERVGDARVVLLGEATRGTHEFYEIRAELTRRLIEEKGFSAVAVEADWPDAYRVNRYVRGAGRDTVPADALGDLRRFPAWTWRNRELARFVDWLRGRNAGRRPEERAGFYGLDLYGLYGSIESVLGYLEKVDPEAARRARYRYACFESHGEDPEACGYAASIDADESGRDEAVRQLEERRRSARQRLSGDGFVARDEQFHAEQDARLAGNAEEYYRAMFGPHDIAWNLRDRHMADTLAGLAEHLCRCGTGGKVAVWQHNSHSGDARATEVSRRGELNVGQLVRERFGGEVFSIGFTTYGGTVSAASDWGAPVERKRVRPALPESYESILHLANLPRFWMPMRGSDDVEHLRRPRLERAIGAIYLPRTERVSHYFLARLPDQFDAVIHVDQTQALEPLDRTALWDEGEPQTYASGS